MATSLARGGQTFIDNAGFEVNTWGTDFADEWWSWPTENAAYHNPDRTMPIAAMRISLFLRTPTNGPTSVLLRRYAYRMTQTTYSADTSRTLMAGRAARIFTAPPGLELIGMQTQATRMICGSAPTTLLQPYRRTAIITITRAHSATTMTPTTSRLFLRPQKFPDKPRPLNLMIFIRTGEPSG